MRRAPAALILCALLAVSPAVAHAAFPGSNGDIVFARFLGEGGGNIFTLGLGTQPQPLTSGRFCRHPSYSGDGERIAFACLTGAMSSSLEIFTMGADGQDEVPVTQNNVQELDPSFSPDGRTIVFTRFEAGDGAIGAIGADGQNEVTLTDTAQSEGGATYSPDGTRIAFVRDDGADPEIWVMNADGSNQVQLTDNTEFDGPPNYSPDGTKLVFARRDGPDNDLYVMDADGANQTPLTDSPGSEATPAYSPDGQNASELTTTSPPEADLQPNWQPLNPPSCELSGPPKQKSFKAVTLTVTCLNENATVAATGSGKAPKVQKLGVTASKAKKFTLEPVTIQVQPDQPTTLTLAVPTKGKMALKKAAKAGKKGKATVAITSTDDFQQSTQETLDVKFKKKK